MKRHRRWLYELPALCFFLYVLERAFFGETPAFQGIEPHPYWLPVLLFSLRYGLAAGASSGAAAALLYLGGVWLRGDRWRFEDADFYRLPFLFLAVGCAAGSAVDRLLGLLRERADAIAGLREKNRSLLKEVWLQKQAARAVEQQVVSQMSSLATLYAGARNLGSLDREALMDGIVDFFAQALKAERCALHLKQGERWVLRAQRGWSEDFAGPKEVGALEGLIGKAGGEDRAVSLRDWGGDLDKAWEGRAEADAVLAGPLRRGPGQVIGVFSVQDMPFLRFNSASMNLLSLLLDWAQEAIEKCLYFEELKSKSILDEVYNVYNERYFAERARQEFSRSKTYSLPFSVLLLSVRGLDALSAERQVNYLRALSGLLLESRREIDIVTKSPIPGFPFAVLMMTATAERAAKARQAVLEAYGRLEFFKSPSAGAPLLLRVGAASFAPAMKSVEEMIDQAREDAL